MRLWLLLALGIPGVAQSLNVPCEPDASTLRMLEAVPPEHETPFATLIRPLREFAERHPGNFFLQLAYNTVARRVRGQVVEFERALSLYRSRPAHPLSRYLEARLLALVQPERTRAVFEELMAAYPHFVWPHLDMLEWTELPGWRDPKVIARHRTAFAAGCPDSLEAQFAGLTPDPARLRRILERRNSPLDSRHWSRLWEVERESGEGRKRWEQRVRRDLSRIEGWVFQPRPELERAYAAASVLLEDDAIWARFRDRLEREAPHSALLVDLVINEWWQQHPRPSPDAAEDARRVWEQEWAAAVDAWSRRWPENCRLADAKWRLIGDKKPLSDSDFRVAEQLIGCHDKFPHLLSASPPVRQRVAELYLRNNVRVAEARKLLADAAEEVRLEKKYPASRALVARFAQGRSPLPEFSAKDLAGGLWTRERLRGKATFVYLWSTSCGPCLTEHPHLEKLHEWAKQEGDIQVLTFAVDEKLQPVTAYMRRRGYTFPVIHDPGLADKLFPYVALPTSFVVDAEAASRRYFFGHTREVDNFVKAELRKAARVR